MKTPDRPFSPRSLLLPCLPMIAILAACSDGTDTGPIGSGSGAGDEELDRLAAENIATLAPFEGIYDLSGNWRGTEGDIAYLLVRAPSDDGISEVVLRDIEEFENCSERPRFSTLEVDDAGGNDEIFLGTQGNQLVDLESGVASLTADGSLALEYRDNGDNDGDGNRDERTRFTAPRIDTTEQDLLPADC